MRKAIPLLVLFLIACLATAAIGQSTVFTKSRILLEQRRALNWPPKDAIGRISYPYYDTGMELVSKETVMGWKNKDGLWYKLQRALSAADDAWIKSTGTKDVAKIHEAAVALNKARIDFEFLNAKMEEWSLKHAPGPADAIRTAINKNWAETFDALKRANSLRDLKEVPPAIYMYFIGIGTYTTPQSSPQAFRDRDELYSYLMRHTEIGVAQ